MHVLRSPEELRQLEPTRPIWATLGTFDGLHQGHRHVIHDLLDRATQHPPPAASLVITFEIHPRIILKKNPPLPILASRHKTLLLEELGVDYTLLLQFDEALSKVEPEAFIEDWLAKTLRVDGVVLGYDNRFGHKARGDYAMLERMGAELGFATAQSPAVYVDGAPISSTRIRTALAEADLPTASELLGRPYSVLGEVTLGHQRGRTIGFPTANLPIGTDFLLPTGVYGVRVRRLDESITPTGAAWGIANLGYRPTVVDNAPHPLLEVHLLDFEQDLYGREIEVEFLQWIRGEQKFDGLDALKAQIAADEATWRRWIDTRTSRRLPRPDR